jgi:hypothetical protein
MSEAGKMGCQPTGQSEYGISRDSLTKGQADNAVPGNLSQQRGQKQTQQVTEAP